MALQIGSRVEVTGKNVLGTVAYLGNTSFAVGKWVGLILDEPKGKNNGLVAGKQYFECNENCGLFVKQNQLTLIDESGNRIDLSAVESNTPPSKLVTPKASRLSSSRQSLTSSTSSIKSNSTNKSREDVSSSTPNIPGNLPDAQVPGSLSKRSSFIERTPSSSSFDSLKTPRTSKLTTPKSYTAKSTFSGLKTPTPVSKKGTPSKTGFVENLKPQFNPGQPLSASTRATPSTPVATPLGDTGLYDEMKAEIQDLKEKLDTMKIKYREKTRDLDEMKIQLDQSAEFKAKIMESQAGLKRELEKLKQEKQEAVEAKEDTADLVETLEMMTLDKEMAEERAETLQVELDLAKEKIEELTLDIELMKADIEKSCDGAGDGTEVSHYQIKQLEQQNMRLRETLVRLRDLSAHEIFNNNKFDSDSQEQGKKDSANKKRGRSPGSADVSGNQGRKPKKQQSLQKQQKLNKFFNRSLEPRPRSSSAGASLGPEIAKIVDKLTAKEKQPSASIGEDKGKKEEIQSGTENGSGEQRNEPSGTEEA